MKRAVVLLAAFSFLGFLSVPASAFTWPISATFTSYGAPGGWTELPGTGLSCNYAIYTSGGANVIQSTYQPVAGWGNQNQFLWASAPLAGDSAPRGGYFQVTFSTTAISVNANSPSGLITIATAGGVSVGATVMTVANATGYSGSQALAEVGVFVNGVKVIDLQNTPLYSATGYFGTDNCSGSTSWTLNAANTSVAPTAPTALNSSSFTNHIDLSWTAATDASGLGVWAYRVYRSDNPSTPLAIVTGTSFSDTTVVPGTQYTYTITAVNQFLMTASAQLTARSAGIPTSGPYPSATPEGRRVGVRSTGTYWGATGENIDVRSGNLNFSFPILSAVGRTGWSVPFNLVYNSQNWRSDMQMYPGATPTTWNYGRDVGYGFGWRLMAGAITPVWNAGGITANYYVFTDASGAEYRLDQNNNNVWSSKESIYVWLDANANVLYFRDGTYWYFGCISAPGEADAGTLYPTVMMDTNGNQIAVAYYSGTGANWSNDWINSSSRLGVVADARSSNSYGVSTAGTYSYIGDGVNWSFAYQSGQALSSPFSGQSFGTTNFLSSVATSAGTTSFSYNGSGELIQVSLPKGGYLKYDYATATFGWTTGWTHSFREVTNRYLSKDGTTGSQTTYAFSHPTGPGTNVESATQLNDPSGVGQKYWTFSTSGFTEGLTTLYQGNQLPGPITKTQSAFTWTQDANSNSYISSTTSTLDPATYPAAKKTNQTLDVYGNVTQVQNFDYGNLTTPAKTYTYTYLNPSSSSLPAYAYNRLYQATVTDGTNTVTLATNTYSTTGMLTNSTTPSGATALTLDSYGNVVSTTVNGVSSTSTYNSSTNFAAPTAITVGSMTANLSYNSFLGLSNETGVNGETAAMTYDTSARPASTTGAFGATTNYTYSTGPYTAANPFKTTATINGRFSRTTVDGLGRTILTESGTVSGSTYTVLSQAETAYDSCGCSPLGKMVKTSLPHAPGTSPPWNTYYYDGIGRTTKTLKSDLLSATTYAYQGNTVTVTDPAGHWKTYTSDAFGHLTKVEEPNPASPTNPSTDYLTTYTFDLLDHLIGVSMPRPSGTQTRTFNYGTPPTALLQSATNPENGTVSYTYDSQNRLATVTDAKSKRKLMTYDSLNRVTQIQRGTWSGGTFTEDLKQRTTFTFGTSSPTNGRLSSVTYLAGDCASATQVGTDQATGLPTYSGNCGLAVESYGYSAPGAMLSKTVALTRTVLAQPWLTMNGSLTASWTYDTEGRATAVTYPTWGSTAGSQYSYAYDSMGRLNTMTNALSSTTMISGVTYGVANEIQQITSANQALIYTETRQYNGLFQLTQLAQWGTGGAVLDRGFTFPSGVNNGKIDSDTDLLSGEAVAYTYDALNRLATAQTTQTGGTQWGQSYNYDGFGNLTDQNVTKGSAPSMHVTYNAANNRQTGEAADANGNIGSGNVFDIDNRMTAPSGTTIRYSYDAGNNKRIWRGDSSAGLDEFDFWAGNQKLATYQVSTPGYPTLTFALKTTNVYFGAKLVSKGTYFSSCSCTDKVTLAPVAADRLGSIGKFYPYGQEKPSATTNDTEKFTGYFRDASSGLDYAVQRYHQPGVGRFMTPDSYSGSAEAMDPGSWNRYAYVGGDPVNYADASGNFRVHIGQSVSIGSFPEDTSSPVDQWGPGGGGMGGSTCNFYGILCSDIGPCAIFGCSPDTAGGSAPTSVTNVKKYNPWSMISTAIAGTKCGSSLQAAFANSQYAGQFASLDDFLTDPTNGLGAVTATADFVGGTATAITAPSIAGGAGSLVFINNSGAFFNALSPNTTIGPSIQYPSQYSSIKGGTPEAQAFILLHELEHVLGAFKSDNGNDTAQASNNDMLWSKCGTVIQGFPNK